MVIDSRCFGWVVEHWRERWGREAGYSGCRYTLTLWSDPPGVLDEWLVIGKRERARSQEQRVGIHCKHMLSLYMLIYSRHYVRVFR